MEKPTEPPDNETPSSEPEAQAYFELIGALEKLAESYKDRLSLAWILKAMALAVWGVEHDTNRKR